MRKISENATIPFQPAPVTDTPMKHRLNMMKNYRNNNDELISNAPKGQYELPMEDTEKIKILFGQYISLFKDKKNEIEVLKRGQTDSGVMYDVYFGGGHAILYIKPEEKLIGLVNRNMDDDDFADVLEDMEEINIEPEDRKFGKLLIGIGREEFTPKIDIEEPEEDIETDVEEVESELDKKMEDNVEDNEEEKMGEPDKEPEEVVDNEEEDIEDNEGEDADSVGEDSVLPPINKIKKENLENKEGIMKVKEILNEYGYVRVTDKNDVISIVEYYNSESLKDFSSFIVKIKGNDYDEIFGVCGSRFDEEKEIIPVVKNGKLIYESSNTKDKYADNYNIGEVVKIDLSMVNGDYMKQIYTLSKRTKGYAIVESIEGDIIRIVENEHKARIKQSVPINKSALIKLDSVKDACVVYEDKEAIAEYQSLLNEAKKASENRIDKKEDVTEVSEDIMHAGFGIRRKINKK